ncbi:LysE family translocator [Streptomyces sp. NPDC001139]
MSVDLIGFLGVVLAAYVVPGPDFLVVLRSAAEHPLKGRAAALGTQAGLCVHMLAAALGLSLIASRSPVVFDVVRLLGAAYLVHLGIRAVSAACRTIRERRAGRAETCDAETCGTETGAAEPRGAGTEGTRTVDTSTGDTEVTATPLKSPEGEAGHRRWRSGFTQGLLTNVLNPKAALFFLSVLPQFVHGGGSTTRQIFFLGFLDVLIGVAYWFALVAVAARLRAFLARPAIRDRWELATSWLFIAIGFGVAAA